MFLMKEAVSLPESRSISTTVYGATSQKNVIFILAASEPEISSGFKVFIKSKKRFRDPGTLVTAPLYRRILTLDVN
jgi:hypothetical protein